MRTPSPHRPRAPGDSLTLTWVGHATFLIQLAGLNLLTDPHFSPRASPVQWAGPRRMSGLPMDIDDLPPIDAVVISHDHYDHLDRGSVRRLARHSPAAQWITPLGYHGWLRSQGVESVAQADWWDTLSFGRLRATCLPVQHWTRRGFKGNQRLWAGWSLSTQASEASSSRSIFFCGDSGYFSGFEEIGARLGPFDASLLPIGAYDPRWFMRTSHMNPEEAVQAYHDLGGSGLFAGMHWGTFRLTDEDPLEPPLRTRAAWQTADLPTKQLWIPLHGETVSIIA